ncbi:MAG: hypothetical protein ITF98_00905 [Fermentimonas sp.]|nr:hypothetical protein [Fermentimonas sp.]
MRKLLLFAFIFISCSFIYGQEKLYKGRVVDAKFHTPVAYTAVYIQNTRYGTVANNIGEFSFMAPDSLNNVQLVIARTEYKLQYLDVDNQLNEEFLITLIPDDFEQRSKTIQDSLSVSTGGFNSFIIKATNFVKDDWIPLGNPETNKFDFGRIQTFPTFNPIEGLRLRAGFASNSRLSPNLFIKGYGAYGFGDQKFKYRGEITYSFDKKAYHDQEFPKNNINLIYENDIYSPGEMHPRSPNNLLLITYRRSENEATYRNFAEVNWDREHQNGMAYTAWVRKSRMVPQGDLLFQRTSGNTLFIDNSLHTTEVGLQLRYAAREAYIQKKRKRIPIETTSPVLFLSHSIGLAEIMGSETPYHRTEISAQKRFVLGYTGRIDVVGEAMKVWNVVPFPLLVYPNQRYRHHIENNAFFLNRALEFVADEQVTLRATFVGDDLLLAKIPIINKLQIRELLSFRASYGRLSSGNQRGFLNSDEMISHPLNLYNFPQASYQYGSKPYVEGTIGITNILGLLRVEYVHRFTYRNHPDALLGKVRIDVTL